MAVTLITGPMDKHRTDVNQGVATKAKSLKCRNQKVKAPSRPSNHYVARIVQSTHDLSDSIRYIGYVIAYSALPSSTEKNSKDTGCSKDSRRTTSIKSQGSNMGLFGLSKDATSKSPLPQARRTPTRDEWGNSEPLYPVTPEGTLREAYVRMCVDKVGEEKFKDGGWRKEYIAEWFGYHLEKEIKAGKAPRNFQAHFEAAVELHARMSRHPRVAHPNGIPTDDEVENSLWRDVVDAMNAGMWYAKASIKHDAGNPECTLEQFKVNFDKTVKEARWNTTGLVQFPAS